MSRLRNFYKTTAVGATLATVLLSLTIPSTAQSAGAATVSDNATGPVETVVVTGSRIVRDGYQAPTPTTVLGSADFEQISPRNIGDILNELPAFSGTQNQATTNLASQLAGGNYVNLRDLGVARSLVLLDSRRITPTANTETVDTNIIPLALIDHVDVVTGGASAAWGSGAVAGVVNFVLKRSIDGFQADISGGESTYGDSGDVRASAAYGTSFGDGRGQLMVGLDYEHNYGVKTQGSRPWEQAQGGVITNPAFTATNGQPKLLSVTNFQWATGTLGGLITSGPLKGTQFGPGGTTSQFQYGSPVSGNYQVGGGGIDPGLFSPLSPPLDRVDAFGRLTYELTSDITATVDFLHARTGTFNGITPYFSQGGITIQRTNAFLPASVVTQLTAANATSFTFGRYSPDWGFINTDTANTTDQGTIALNGKFGDGWTWNAYGTTGRTDYRLRLINDVLTGNLSLALNSVISPATGQASCVSTLTNPTNGCVPLNPFGQGSASAAALNYIHGNVSQQAILTQNVAGWGVNGDPFSTWAGEVSVAAGFEYRRETINQAVDALSQANSFFIGNPHATVGAYSVEEGYLETVVPLLHGLSFAKELDFNGAVRETNYSSGAVTAWKLGLTYNVTDDLTLRLTRSRDIRAPNLNELYQPNALTLPTVVNPATLAQTTVQQIVQGNPNLTPELSDTLTYGVVLTPTWLPGFNFSADVYNIVINNAIVTATSQTIVNNCFAGVTSQCNFVTRDANGNITAVNDVYFNLPRQSTRGIDFESSYQMSLSDLNSNWDGTFALRGLATYVTNLLIAAGYNQAGEVGTGTSPPASGVPHFRADGHATYSNGPLTTDVEVRYIGGGKYSQNNGVLGISNNNVSSQTIVSLNATYTIPTDLVRSLQIYGNIHNLFDQDPPFDPYNFSAPNTSNPAIYDLLGRTFTAGVRFQL